MGGQPPVGLRALNNQNIRYICQPPTPEPQPPQPPPQVAENAIYATMFDERQGIAVFSAYSLTQETADTAPNLVRHPWCKTPGKLLTHPETKSLEVYQLNIISASQDYGNQNVTRKDALTVNVSRTAKTVVQSLNSPFFPPHRPFA